MKTGAEAILQYIGTRADKFVKVGISQIEDNPDSHPTPHIHCCAAILEQLSQFRDLIEKQQPTSINTLGGDCGIEIIPVSYLNHRLQLSNAGKLGVLWFDAHTDLNLPQESPSKNFHGMPVRTLLGEGAAEMIGLMFSTLEPEQVVYVGARDLDPPEKEYIAAKEIKLLQKLNVGELKSILQDKAITHVYVHLDLDCLDPEEYPHTFYQVARGLGSYKRSLCSQDAK